MIESEVGVWILAVARAGGNVRVRRNITDLAMAGEDGNRIGEMNGLGEMEVIVAHTKVTRSKEEYLSRRSSQPRRRASTGIFCL
jgi:hypothetical protein